jgi:CO/xanthine dehydrogenase FAD-binding subunit
MTNSRAYLRPPGEDGELTTQVTSHVPDTVAYRRFQNSASRHSAVAASVAKTEDDFRVAITGASRTVFRVVDTERAFTTSFTAEISVPADNLNRSLHATVEHRPIRSM